jgi:hypothetical protein
MYERKVYTYVCGEYRVSGHAEIVQKVKIRSVPLEIHWDTAYLGIKQETCVKYF